MPLNASPWTPASISTTLLGGTTLIQSAIVVSVLDKGADPTGVNDSTTAIQAAVTAAGSGTVYFPAGTYLITSTITVSSPNQTWRGAGKGVGGTSNLTSSANIIQVTVASGAYYFHCESMCFTFTGTGHTAYHVVTNVTGNPVTFRDCFFNGTATDFVGGGISFASGDQGHVDTCTFNHASINVNIYDVKITDCYIWALSKPFGIYLSNNAGNCTIHNTDIVGPAMVTGGGVTAGPNPLASIWITGACLQPVISNCYFDGNNAGILTSPGIVLQNGVLGATVAHNRFNLMYSHGMVVDSCINTNVESNSFYGGNKSGIGSNDIFLTQGGAGYANNSVTSAQAVVGLHVHDNTHIQTSAVSGTKAAAIRLYTGVTRNGIRIERNRIYQPGAGGGYTDVEIGLDDGAFSNSMGGSLKGNVGTRTLYVTSGSVSYLANAASSSPTWPVGGYGANGLAYAPRPDQITLSTASTGSGPAMSFNSASLPTTSGMGVYFNGTFPAGTLYYSVDLS